MRYRNLTTGIQTTQREARRRHLVEVGVGGDGGERQVRREGGHDFTGVGRERRNLRKGRDRSGGRRRRKEGQDANPKSKKSKAKNRKAKNKKELTWQGVRY